MLELALAAVQTAGGAPLAVAFMLCASAVCSKCPANLRLLDQGPFVLFSVVGLPSQCLILSTCHQEGVLAPKTDRDSQA